jgi:hypothetical protein
MAQPSFAYYEPAILQGESGGDWNALYGYQNRAGGLFGDVKVSDMTINEVLDFQRAGSPYATYVRDILGYTATPVGGYQIVGQTLQGAKEGMGLTGEEKFDPAMQRKVAQYIFDTQGPSAWEALKGTQMADQMTPQQMAPQQAAGYQPFSPENLSRSQRTMLGFAALRDAAAALRGNQTSYFGEALGGLEAQHRYGQELAFRQGQEQRILGQERQTRELTLLQQRRLIQTERDKAYNLGMPTTGYDAQLAAVDGALSQMGSAFAPSVAPVTPAMQPEAVAPAETGTEQPAPPRMTLDEANKLLTGGAATPQQLRDAADFFLRNDMTDRANMALAAAQQLEAQTQAETAAAETSAEEESVLRPRLETVLGYMIDPETGDINSAALLAAEASPFKPLWYRDYVTSLETINSIVGMGTLKEAKAAWSGTMTDRDIEIIFSQKGTFDPTDPIGTLRSVMQIYKELNGAPVTGQAKVVAVDGKPIGGQ